MSTPSSPARLIRTGLLCAGIWLGALAPASEIVLPIEVLGPVQTTRTVTVASGAPVAALSLRVHGLAHANMAQVQVGGGGAWIPLNNTTANVVGMAARFG